ncbi:hypothetical protein ACOBV8_21655 (plasmid) [Pseudoalteromonas espejiana]
MSNFFAMMMLGDDRCIENQTYIMGKSVYKRAMQSAVFNNPHTAIRRVANSMEKLFI